MLILILRENLIVENIRLVRLLLTLLSQNKRKDDAGFQAVRAGEQTWYSKLSVYSTPDSNIFA